MLCKYCNADLKPEDKVCPVCEKPLDDTDIIMEENDISNNVVEQPDDVIDSTELLYDSEDVNFEPVQEENEQLLEKEKLNEQYIQDDNYTKVPLEVKNINKTYVKQEHKEYKNPMEFVPLIIFVFVIIIFGFSFLVSCSPKMIFNNLINRTYKEINSNVVKNIKNMKGSMSLQTNISTKDEYSSEIFDILNNIYFGLDYELDYENEKALIKLNTKYDNEKLLDADVYFKDEKGYILLKDVYNKYLSTDMDDFDDIFEKVEVTSDHKIVLNEIKKAIIRSLKTDYFTKEKTDITINEETLSVTKNSLVLKDETILAIEKDFLTYLKDSDKFILSLSDITDTTKEEISATFEETLKSLELNNVQSNNEEVVISIYTEGLLKNIVKIDLVTSGSVGKTTMELFETKENEYSIVLNSVGSTINGFVKILENTKENKKIEFSITEPTSGTTIALTISMSTKYNTKLTNVDVSNSVDINTLTEEETNEIFSKLMENKGIQNLMGAFEGLNYTTPNYDEIVY